MLNIKKRNEITELLFKYDKITDNIYILNNSNTYQIIAILCNKDDNKKPRYFLLNESPRFQITIPKEKLKQLNKLQNQFDYISLLYTKPQTVLKPAVLNKLKIKFCGNLFNMNFNFMIDKLIQNTDKYLNEELGIKTIKHVVISHSYLIMYSLVKNVIIKQYFDMSGDANWNESLVNK